MVQRVKGWFQGVINFLWRPTNNESFQLSTLVEYLMRGSLRAATTYISSTNIQDRQYKSWIHKLLVECRKHQICQFEQVPSQYEKLFYLLLSKQYVAAQELVSEKQLGISQRKNWFALINKFKHFQEVDGDRLLQFLRNLTSLEESKWEEYISRASHQFSKETFSVLERLIEKKALKDCQKRYQLDQKKKVKKECSETVMSLLKVLSELNLNSVEVINRQIKDEQIKVYLTKIGSHLQSLKCVEEDLAAIKMQLQSQSTNQLNEESTFLKTGTSMGVFSNISFIKDSLLASPKSLNKLHCGKGVLISQDDEEARVNFDKILKRKLQDRVAAYSKEHDVAAVTNLDNYEGLLKQMIQKTEQVNHEVEIQKLIEAYTKQTESAKANTANQIEKQKEITTEQISRLTADLERAQSALKIKQEQLVWEKAQIAAVFTLGNTYFQHKNIKSVKDCEKLFENILNEMKKQIKENCQLTNILEEANQFIRRLQTEKVLLKDNSQEIQGFNLQIEQLRGQNEKTNLILREKIQEKLRLNSKIENLSCENKKLQEEIAKLKEQSEGSISSYLRENKQLKQKLGTLKSEKQQSEKERKQQTARMGRLRVQIETIKGNLSKIKGEKQSISQLLAQDRQAALVLSSENILLTFNELFRRFLHQIRANINMIKNYQTELQVAIKSQQELLSKHLFLVLIELTHAIEAYALKRTRMSIEQMSHDYRSYFNADILFENRNTYKTFLVQSLQANVNCNILSTRLLYKYDRLNKSSFHIYVDNIPHLLLLIETEENQLISAYIQNALTPEHINGCTLLMSLTQWGCFRLKPDKRAIVYNQFYFILGNTDLRIKVQDKSVYSNLGISNTSFFETGGKNYQDLLGKGRKNPREATFKSIEFYQVSFMPQNENM